MKRIDLLVLLLFLSVLSYFVILQPTPPTLTKTINITIPDPRISALETRIQTLEEWAQRHGAKY